MRYITVEDTFQYLSMIPCGNLIEFGVFSGNTLNRLIKGAESANHPFKEVYGFDSWIGLPKEAPFVWQNPEWPEGAFNVCHDFNLASPEEATEFVRKNVERKDINLISGFFESSLTTQLGDSLSFSASYIHCDVDIYRSAYECMDWIWKHKILKPQGIIRYDDWISTPSNAGQQLAHVQLQEKYDLVFKQIESNLFQFVMFGQSEDE